MSSASPMADSPEPGLPAEPVPPTEETGALAEAPAPPPSPEEVQASVEALLYASATPLSLRDLRKALPEAGEQIRPAVERLRELYAQEGRGLQLAEVAGGFQITTRPEQHEVVSRLFEGARPTRLTLQALETLAVIAYRQPVTVPEIMDLRGVRSASVVRTLLERKLIRIVGRKSVVGRPLMYGTTREFLLRFGLKDLRDLPQLKDMSEVFGDEAAQAFEVLDALPSPPVHESAGAEDGSGDEDARAD
jgi:segregation and condensation protein B